MNIALTVLEGRRDNDGENSSGYRCGWLYRKSFN